MQSPVSGRGPASTRIRATRTVPCLVWRSLLFVVVVLPSPVSPTFVLEGSPTSFAQFRKWYAGLNGTFEFEFKTEEPNGLLMYTDDGGTFDFFEVKLVEGALRLRFNLGGGASILTVGRNLHDKTWHKVVITRDFQETRLTVDKESQSRLSRGSEFYFGNFTTNSFVYIGGMPGWYATKLTSLALPSVIFEPRFRGAIRNLVFADDEGTPKRQEKIDFKGVRFHKLDQCTEHQDPCLNGGICISTDSGAICDCRAIDFEGTYCDKEKAPSEATFRGNEFLYYDLAKVGGEPIVSSSDEVSLAFKTRQPNGLLFYTGDGEDFLNLALKDGGVVLTINLGVEALEKQVKPSRVRFDDNQWHKVTVHRKVREITGSTSFCHFSMTVDGVYAERGTTTGIFSMLSSNVVYIGGSDNTEGLPGSRIRSNFVGCLRKVGFTADSLNLNLIELGRLGNKLINVHGNIQFMCQEVEAADPITFTNKESFLGTGRRGDPITFTTAETFLVLPSWEATRSGSISFKIRTNEPNGLLMYNSGATTAGGDFFAFEMMDGHVYLLLNLGSGAVKVKASNRRVDDGHWHAITLRRSGQTARVTVDDSAADFATPGESNQLDLEGALFLGGVGTTLVAISIPVELWTGALQYGYVGCMRDLVVNGNAIDIATYAKKQDSGSIRPACHTLPPQCDSQPCMNGGVCSEGWNRFICDCSATNFGGPTCGKDATTLSFDGDQKMKLFLTEESRTQTEDIVLRFRTTRPSGLLLATTTEKTVDRMELAMELGRVKLGMHLGDKEKVLHAGSGLNDNQWHTLRVSRRGRSVELRVDDEPAILDEVSGKHTTLQFRTIHIGAVSPSPSGSPPTKESPNFVGHMQQFVFNGNHYFEMVQNGQMSNYNVTAKFGKKEQIVHHPVTFKSKYTYVGLAQLKAYSTMNLYFQFKTLEPNGLIMYNMGKGQDFIAIELVNGHLHYLFNLGDRPWRMPSNTRNTLNDNRWHAVTIGRPTVRQHTLMVDDMIATVTSAGNNIHLDLDGILYLGGVPKAMYTSLPKMIQSKHGFEGCLASLDLNGETPDPTVDAQIPSTSVVAGCDGPSTKCSPNACYNRGVCIQQWNSYTCDCDMTSYTGPTCADESLAYEFNPDHGLIIFSFPPDKRPDTKGDLLALGFFTRKDKATLVHIESSSSNDFMELSIDDGYILMVYNMGAGDHPIGEMGVKVNDGQYHVVRFTRSGANSTFQLDDYNVQTKHPGGKQLNVFNSQTRIQIGGKMNVIKRTIEKPFEGIIAGLVFNGLRVLDAASEKDPRVTTYGDISLVLSLPVPPMGRTTHSSGREPMQQTSPASGGDGDDIVSSGYGCVTPDDEDCTTTIEPGSGDDLITPVYVPTTPIRLRKTTASPVTRKQPAEGSGKHCEDDEDDCDQGSGSGDPGLSHSTVTPDDMFFPSTVSGTTSTSSPRPPISLKPTLDLPTHLPVTSQQPSATPEKKTKSTPGYIPPLTMEMTTWPPTIALATLESLPSYTYRPPGGKGKTESGGPPGSNADTTALIIGIIAGILIAIVLIILLVYKCRNRSDGSYKIDESKNYQFAAGGGVGISGSSLMLNGQQPQMNGNLKMGEKANKLPKKKDLKDIKEWYV